MIKIKKHQIDDYISDSTQTALNAKQNTLVSTVNIKSINGNSILGSGDLTISGGGGGATNLAYTPSSTNGIVTSDTGTDATIPLADVTNAGLLTPSEKTKIANSVPYTGATTDVNLGLNDITAAKLIKDGGFDYQFLKADGSVDNNTYLTSADLPSTLDLYATTTASDISGYTVLVRNIADTRYNATAVDVSTGVITSVGQLVGSLITNANIISGNPGVFDFKTIGNISRTNGTGQAEFFFRIYKRNLAGTETLIAQSDYTLPVTNGGYVEFSATALWNDGIFLDTDRVVLKYYANRLTSPVGSDPTYQFQFGGLSPVRSSAAIPTSVMPNIYLRDLADVENVDALNNEILYWNDPASLWEHSLAENLVPLATATQKGLVSTTTQTFAGAKTFSSNPKIPINPGNIGAGGIVIDDGTGQIEVANNLIYPNTTELTYVKGVTSGIQTQLNAKSPLASPTFTGTVVLPSTTSIGTVSSTEIGYLDNVTSSIQTQLNGKQEALSSTVNIKSINGNSILGSGDLTITASAASQGAYTMLANNTASSAVPTEKPFENITNDVYSGTIVWTGGAAPTVPNHTYSLSQVGNLVTLMINLSYGTVGGTGLTNVTMELPSTAPTPALPSSVTAAGDVLSFINGNITTSKATPTTNGICVLRLKSTSPNVFEASISRASGSHRYAYATIQYFV